MVDCYMLVDPGRIEYKYRADFKSPVARAELTDSVGEYLHNTIAKTINDLIENSQKFKIAIKKLHAQRTLLIQFLRIGGIKISTQLEGLLIGKKEIVDKITNIHRAKKFVTEREDVIKTTQQILTEIGTLTYDNRMLNMINVTCRQLEQLPVYLDKIHGITQDVHLDIVTHLESIERPICPAAVINNTNENICPGDFRTSPADTFEICELKDFPDDNTLTSGASRVQPSWLLVPSLLSSLFNMNLSAYFHQMISIFSSASILPNVVRHKTKESYETYHQSQQPSSFFKEPPFREVDGTIMLIAVISKWASQLGGWVRSKWSEQIITDNKNIKPVSSKVFSKSYQNMRAQLRKLSNQVRQLSTQHTNYSLPTWAACAYAEYRKMLNDFYADYRQRKVGEKELQEFCHEFQNDMNYFQQEIIEDGNWVKANNKPFDNILFDNCFTMFFNNASLRINNTQMQSYLPCSVQASNKAIIGGL